MPTMLISAAAMCIALGIAHSYLGERYILIRLFRRTDLPALLGDDRFTRRTLRFAWHLTSIAWWGFAALLLLANDPDADLRLWMLRLIAAVFGISGLLTFGASRGRHPAWIVFFAIAGLSMAAS